MELYLHSLHTPAWPAQGQLYLYVHKVPSFSVKRGAVCTTQYAPKWLTCWPVRISHMKCKHKTNGTIRMCRGVRVCGVFLQHDKQSIVS
jgi:hypothetical protein